MGDALHKYLCLRNWFAFCVSRVIQVVVVLADDSGLGGRFLLSLLGMRIQTDVRTEQRTTASVPD